MTVRKLPEPTTDVFETLESVMEDEANIELVMIAVLKKDGSQVMVSSTGNMHQKCFLLTFINAWAHRWFNE